MKLQFHSIHSEIQKCSWNVWNTLWYIKKYIFWRDYRTQSSSIGLHYLWKMADILLCLIQVTDKAVSMFTLSCIYISVQMYKVTSITLFSSVILLDNWRVTRLWQKKRSRANIKSITGFTDCLGLQGKM